MRYLFCDIETTGLVAGVDEPTEIAWILDDGTERHFIVEHRRLPNDWVLRETDYLQRIALAPKTALADVLAALRADCADETYLVGACPAFDDRFLRLAFAAIGHTEPPYSYHVIDVEAVAMGALGHDKPCSLKDLRAALGIAGENPAAHTALSDAREVKLIWDALRRRRNPAAAQNS